MSDIFDDYFCEGQMTIFDFLRKPFKITNKIRLIELFGGIGSQAAALRNIGADFEHYRLCEWEQHAVDSYNAIHGTDFEASDITKLKGDDLGIVDTDKYTYILTYSFPCQDLSVAGSMRGYNKGSSTRSGLLWEVERLLTEVKELPQVLIMENVIQVHSEGDNMENFKKWVAFLTSKGYSSYWEDLNAKDYGMPQNRRRTIMVSILGEYNYKFPRKLKKTKTAYDYLNDKVGEEYYLDTKKCELMVEELKDNGVISERRKKEQKSNKEPVLIMDYRYDEGCRPRKDNCCPTLTCHTGGGENTVSSNPLIVEEWIWNDTEYDKPQNRATSK